MNEKLKSRLENWKFKQALQYVDDSVSEDEKNVIGTLARLFGDCGWLEGDVGTLISVAVRSLTEKEVKS